MKTLCALAVSALITSAVHAATPEAVIAANQVNLWIQGGVATASLPFDLAIQGNGFFILQMASGEQKFSRHGEMQLDAEGYLVQGLSGGKVIGTCGGELQPINLARFAKHGDSALVQSFRVELNGTITAFYQNGHSAETCRIALALFQNPRRLKRSGHILESTKESGPDFIGPAREEGRGDIFRESREVLEEGLYLNNIDDSKPDRVSAEMERVRRTNEEWNKQKTLFYVYDLKLSREELAALESSAEVFGQKMNSLVKKASVSHIADREWSVTIEAARRQHETEAADILGQDRLEKAQAFREDFNQHVFEKFGTDLKFTAY